MIETPVVVKQEKGLMQDLSLCLYRKQVSTQADFYSG